MKLSEITICAELQPRAQLNWIVVAEYAEAMKAGATFPPVVVFYDGSTHWLADGFHRVSAARDYAGLTEFPADVRQGNKRDAEWFALGANKAHGLRRTNEDKKRVVEKALGDVEWREKSNYEIADHCGVSDQTVSNYRKTIYQTLVDKSAPKRRKAKRNGKTYTVDTTNIGKRTPEPVEPEPPQSSMFTESESEHEQTTAPDYEPEPQMQPETETLPDPQAEPVVTLPASRIEIINADAQNLIEHVMEPVHLVVTSPPYNVGKDYDAYVDNLSTYIPFLTSVWRQCYDVMTEGARIAVVVPFGVGRNPYIPFDCQIMQTLTDAGFTLRGRIVWDKNATGNRTSWGSFRLPTNPSIRDTTEAIIVAHKGDGGLEIPDTAKLRDDKGTYSPWLVDSDYFMGLAQDHWVVTPESAQRVKHPAPFPVELVRRLMHFYAYPGAHILDPFAGSGTVGVAAQEVGCDATLIEISADYCALAKERLNL